MGNIFPPIWKARLCESAHEKLPPLPSEFVMDWMVSDGPRIKELPCKARGTYYLERSMKAMIVGVTYRVDKSRKRYVRWG